MSTSGEQIQKASTSSDGDSSLQLSNELKKLNNLPDTCPILLDRSSELGRFLVASRDITEGEIIFREIPLLVGPQNESAPICLGCYKPLGFIPPHTCSKCEVALLCGASCETSTHHIKECISLRNARPSSKPLLLGDEGNWQVILPLRCITNQIKEVFQLESHLEERRRNIQQWENCESTVVNVLYKHGLLRNFPSLVIQRICGILDVNCFEVRGPPDESGRSECLRALYQNAAFMAHSCVPNTHVSIDSNNNNFTIIIKAAKNIKKGELIYNNYTDTLLSTAMRREFLKIGKYFSCKCERCLDPTELGTHLSSLKCLKTSCKGALICNDPLKQIETDWQCNMCHQTQDSMTILDRMKTIQQDLSLMDRTNATQMETLLIRLQRHLHSNNAAILEVIQALSGLYREQLMESGPSIPLLKRKLELCSTLLPIVELLEPPLSRLRGIALYEVASPIAALALQQHGRSKTEGINEVRSQLETAEEKLREAARLLLHEPPGAPEAQLARVALVELKDVRQEIANLAKVSKKLASKNKSARKKNK